MITNLKSPDLTEHMAATDMEAIQSIASMYNAENKTLKLTNLDVTGNIKAASADIGAFNIATNTITTAGRMHISSGEDIYFLPKGKTRVSKAWGGTGTLIVDDGVNVTGNVTATGNGTFGNAFVGSSPHTGWAQFSHKLQQSGTQYALIQNGANGHTLLNSPTAVNIRKSNDDNASELKVSSLRMGNNYQGKRHDYYVRPWGHWFEIRKDGASNVVKWWN